ncbi:MAG: DUF4105 domain-containing protein, partial [Methylobacterium sp.]
MSHRSFLETHPGGLDPDRPIREGNARMAPLWQVLVGGEAVRRHAHLILAAGVALALLGVAVMIDALAGAARRLRIFKGLFLALAAILIMMASASSFFLLAMLFGTVFLVDGMIRIVLAYLLKFPEWRTSVALGALGVAFGVFHLQPWPTWYVGTVGYCIGMFLVINGLRLALAGLRTRRTAPEPVPEGASAPGSDSLTVYVWTPTGQATTPATQRLVRRYVASVDVAGRYSTGHAALELAGDLYISHYPAVEIDRSPANLRSSLRAGPENDVPGRFLPSHRAEVADWCEATVAVTLNGVDGPRLRAFW